MEVAPRAFTSLEFGDCYLQAGDRIRAEAAYLEAVPLAEKAFVARAQDMQLRREVADAYERLGAMYESSGDLPKAQEWYRKSLGIWRDWTKHVVSSVYNQRREVVAMAAVRRVSNF